VQGLIMAAGSKHQAWRELKRAGQIHRWGPVVVVSDEAAANEIPEAEWLAADLARDTDKGPKLAAQAQERALDSQLNGPGSRS
jgi:hypothetical protein